MLPKPVYENLPYVCILLAVCFFQFPASPLQLSCASILFFAGSRIWFIRSKHRRPDRVTALFNPSFLPPFNKRFILPHFFYEALPFICIALGWVTIQLIASLIGQVAGGLLMLMGATIWRMRHMHRMKSAAVLVRI